MTTPNFQTFGMAGGQAGDCDTGDGCKTADDCTSHVCTSGVCQ